MSRSYQQHPHYRKYYRSMGRDNRQMYHKAYRSMVRHAIRNCRDYDELVVPHYNQGWDVYDWPDTGGGWDSYYDALKEDDNRWADHRYYYWKEKHLYIKPYWADKFDGVKAWKRRRRK